MSRTAKACCHVAKAALQMCDNIVRRTLMGDGLSLQCVLAINDRRQCIVADFDKCGCIFGNVPALCNNDRNTFADVTDLIDRQGELRQALFKRRMRKRQWGTALRQLRKRLHCKNGMHTLDRFSRAGINGIDFCVGVRTANKSRMQDTVHFEIIDKLRFPE